MLAVSRWKFNPTPKEAERRYDQYGEFRLMAEAEGYVLFRRKGCAAHAMTRKEWDALARLPIDGAGRPKPSPDGKVVPLPRRA